VIIEKIRNDFGVKLKKILQKNPKYSKTIKELLKN